MVNSRVEQAFLDQLQTIFASLQPEEVEQFYAAYRQWLLQQRIVELRQRLVVLQEHIGENELRIQQYRPSPMALASIARLQSNGVSDIDLIDQMLERGEDWLDTTMQHLDYFEQFENFLSDDYTQWCRRALEGAFEWMDSMLTAGAVSPSAVADAHGETAYSEDAGETEAMLLQKLASEAEDDQLAGEEPTLKQPAAKLPVPDEAQLQQVAVEDAPLETGEAGTGQQPGTGEAGADEEKEMTPDEAALEREEIRANEAPTGDEENATGETTAGEENKLPGQPVIMGTGAESSSDIKHEQPVLAELTVVEHTETNGASAADDELPAVNTWEEQPSPPSPAPMTRRRKRSIMLRLVAKLLGW